MAGSLLVPLLALGETKRLKQVYDQIEESNAERMKYLVELVKIKDVSLKDLMSSLGIKPGADG